MPSVEPEKRQRMMVSPITGQFPRKEMAFEPVKGAALTEVTMPTLGSPPKALTMELMVAARSAVAPVMWVSACAETARAAVQAAAKRNLTFIDVTNFVYFGLVGTNAAA